MVDHATPSDGEMLDPDPLNAATPRAAGESLCTLFVERLAVTGASISVVGGRGQLTIGASDAVSARLEELQFELGEGPHHEALASGKPILVADLNDSHTSRWPVFGLAAAEIGVGALFAFPLTIGAAIVGVVDMYRLTPGDLDSRATLSALALASAAAVPALRLAAQSARVDAPDAEHLAPELRREVHQATGMLLVQLGITATEAFSHLQAHAFSLGKTLEYVAHEVVARRIDFRKMTD